MSEIFHSEEQLNPPINPLTDVTTEEARQIIELLPQTNLPQREIAVGEYDCYKTLLVLKPLLDMGYGQYLTEEFLEFIGHYDARSFLASVEKRPDDTLLEALSSAQNRVIPEQRQDPRVVEARALIAEVLEAYKDDLAGKPACGMLWGSMQYGDPSTTPDIDFDIVIDHPEVPETISDGEKIEHINQTIADKGYGAHTQIFSLVEFNQLLDELEKGIFVEVNKLWDMSGLLLSAERIAIPGADQEAANAAIDYAARRIYKAAEINPIYRSLVCMDLRSINDDWRKMQRPVRRDIEEAKSVHE